MKMTTLNGCWPELGQCHGMQCSVHIGKQLYGKLEPLGKLFNVRNMEEARENYLTREWDKKDSLSAFALALLNRLQA